MKKDQGARSTKVKLKHSQKGEETPTARGRREELRMESGFLQCSGRNRRSNLKFKKVHDGIEAYVTEKKTADAEDANLIYPD